jgi:hypothetical protein
MERKLEREERLPKRGSPFSKGNCVLLLIPSLHLI